MEVGVVGVRGVPGAPAVLGVVGDSRRSTSSRYCLIW